MRVICRIPTVVVLVISVALQAGAQANGRGFLFQSPRWSVTIRSGLSVPRAQSDVFDFTSEQLTVDRSDFRSATFGADVGVRVLPWTHLVLSLDNARSFHHSEFRDYIDNNDLPIEQATKFARLNVALGVKQYLLSPGRSIGRLAWVPARIVPFVGAGAGLMRYEFHQFGDFVDFNDMDIFTAQFESSGWTPTAHARAGLDYSFSPRFGLMLQGRYDWAKRATLSRDFEGFDRIDLAGFSSTAGLTVRF